MVMRWAYTFVLLFTTLGWAYFLIKSVEWAVAAKTDVSIIEAAGVGTVLGVLLTLNVNVNQFFFRKRPSTDSKKSE
ncbi:MAG TPA: hypothetical protein VMW64_07450 [Dehalococcoidia bacterium]|nr:hypothetical protein [Dehalococcoidia bacterium]